MQTIIDSWQTIPPATHTGGFTTFDLIRHLWLAPLLWSLANAIAWWVHVHREAGRNPFLRRQYSRLIFQILIVYNVPWLVAGAAMELPIIFPALPSLPLFLIFLLTFIASCVISFQWVYFRGGAEILAYRFEAIIPRHPLSVKSAFPMILFGPAVWLVAAYWFNFAG